MIEELRKSGERQERQNAEHDFSPENHPMIAELENGINAMERAIAGMTFKLLLLKRVHSDALEMFGIGPKPEPEGAPAEKTKKQAPPAEPENPRLAALEQGVKNAIKTLGKAPMLKRFKSLKRLQKTLIAAMNAAPGLTENERIALLEATIGEALDYFQTAKMASRSNVLKEIKKVLEETIDKKNQIQE
jgi:hypothetical protein